MGLLHLIVCCALVAVVTSQSAPANARFCLDLLKSQDKAQTRRALLSCVSEVKNSVERQGRSFSLQEPDVIPAIGRCIAVQVGVVDASGNVIKPELERRVRNSRKISEQERNAYLAEIPTCNTWRGCLQQKCKLL